MPSPLDFFSEPEHQPAKSRVRAQVFAYYLGHLRRHPECINEKVFKHKAPDYQFLQAKGRIEIYSGDKKEVKDVFYFGRIQNRPNATSIDLDSSTGVSIDLLDSAALYRFSLPVFPQGTQPTVADALTGSGVLGVDLQKWLASTGDMNGDGLHGQSRAPKLAVICTENWLDARRQLSPNAIPDRECLELGFLLSSCDVIVLYGDGGNHALSEYLRSNWKTWYEKWVQERAENGRLRFFEATTAEDLRRVLNRRLSFDQLKSVLVSAPRDYSQQED